MENMDFLFRKVEIKPILNLYKDNIIDYSLEHRPAQRDLIIVITTNNEGCFRLQIVEPVDVEEKKIFDKMCESLKIKSLAVEALPPSPL